MLRFPVKIQDFKIGDFIVKMVESCSKMITLRFPVKIQDFKISDFIVKMVELCSNNKRCDFP